MPAKCSIPWCASPVKSRGFCNKHWIRWQRHKTPFTQEEKAIIYQLNKAMEIMRESCDLMNRPVSLTMDDLKRARDKMSGFLNEMQNVDFG